MKSYPSFDSVWAPITEDDLSMLRFAEEIGDVRIWSMTVEDYRPYVLAHGLPDALQFFQESEDRLVAAKRWEDANGECSLLRLDHSFNLEFRHKSPRIRAAYDRYERNPNFGSAEMSGGSQSENEMTPTSGA